MTSSLALSPPPFSLLLSIFSWLLLLEAFELSIFSSSLVLLLVPLFSLLEFVPSEFLSVSDEFVFEASSPALALLPFFDEFFEAELFSPAPVELPAAPASDVSVSPAAAAGVALPGTTAVPAKADPLAAIGSVDAAPAGSAAAPGTMATLPAEDDASAPGVSEGKDDATAPGDEIKGEATILGVETTGAATTPWADDVTTPGVDTRGDATTP